MIQQTRVARRTAGFTLIEMMIAVAVLGILAAIAYPSFSEQIRKSRRADAVAALTQVMQAQERYRANNPAYADDMASLTNVATTSEKGYYTIGIVAGSGSASGYSATATATGAQSSDAACTALSITMAQGSITYGRTGSGEPNACWNR